MSINIKVKDVLLTKVYTGETKQVNYVLIGLTLKFEYSDLSILVVSSFGHQTDNGSFK